MAELTKEQITKRDEIAKVLQEDPEFHPIEGRTKEQSAFAVATAQVQQDGEEGNPMPEAIKNAILEEAGALRVSGDVELESKGLILQVAVAREDLPAIRKVLSDLSKTARELGVESNAEAWDYLRESIPKEAHHGDG